MFYERVHIELKGTFVLFICLSEHKFRDVIQARKVRYQNLFESVHFGFPVNGIRLPGLMPGIHNHRNGNRTCMREY